MNQAANVTVSLVVGRQTGHMKVEVPLPNLEVQGANVETCSPVSTQVCIEHHTKQRCKSHVRHFGKQKTEKITSEKKGA